MFNDFIERNSLLEIPLVGKKFTRICENGLKFSKLDRFLVSDNFAQLWNDLAAISLYRKLTDHSPILLKNGCTDFRPKPFWVFDAWFDEVGVEDIIVAAWNETVTVRGSDSIFRLKLKNVKVRLREWSNNTYGKLDLEIKELINQSNLWELEAENRTLSDNERHEWLNARSNWVKKDKVKRNMLKQKARIRWAVEGDENSKFFHSCIKQRNLKNNIRGLHINGVWQEGPEEIKEEAFNDDLMAELQWFWERCVISPGCNASFITLIPKKKDPLCLRDYRPIILLGSYYKIIAKVLSCRLRGVIYKLVGVEQTAYIKGRSILDSILVANELIDDVMRRKSKCFSFKADFEKAFDSVRWSFLFDIMTNMGFGQKWIRWIETCFRSASILVLINGSPTKELSLQRGIRQGDPLSPYLFIIAGEGLNILSKIAVREGLILGVEVGLNKVGVSHLQFADDTIFFGGVKGMCQIMGCSAGLLPFNYLGVPIGDNMSKHRAWKPVIEKFTKRLSDWKARSMSYG
ncbi:uncharacterized protein [Rutidosis leptorrhynchoides]|uniref:uncharacterized protein n=1 Tax=Rutidosis leptorrhynchoides TaxID=125765 RepID=UPI003A99FC99